MKSIVIIALFALWSCTMAFDLHQCAIPVDSAKNGFYLCDFTQIPAFNVSDDLLNTVTFSIAKPTVQNCQAGDAVFGSFNGTIEQLFQTDCTDIANDNDPAYNLIDANNATAGLDISYETVFDGNNSHQLTILLKCDPSADVAANTSFTLSINGTPYVNGTTTGANYTYNIIGYSKHGCPVFSLQPILDFVANNKVVFTIVFGLLGAILTFLGLKLFKFTVFTITAIVGALVTGTIFFQFTTLGSASWVLYTVFGVSILLGVVLGVLALKLEKIGFFCVGAGLGLFGGLMLYNAIIVHLIKEGAGTTPMYVSLGICAVIGGIIAFFIFEHVLIIATSLIGSYIVIRIISLYAGGFPNEAKVAENLEKFDSITYVYLASILVLAILGMFVQFKTKAAREDKEDSAKPGNYAYYRY